MQRRCFQTFSRPRLLPWCLLLLCLLLSLAACTEEPVVPKGPQVLEWGVAEPGIVKRVLEAAGVVKSRPGALIRVGTRMGGQISKLFVRTGEIVHKGQLLALVDDRELQTQRSVAVAKLEGAKAELQRQQESREKRLEEARASLAASRGQQGYADKNRERRDILFGQGNLPGNDVDAARRDSKTADLNVTNGQAVLGRIESDTAGEIQKAQAVVDAAQAGVEYMDVRLTMTRIESPIDGIVGLVSSQEGEQVVAELEAVNILTIIDPRFLELWVYINEADAAGVRPGMPVRFIKPTHPKDVLEAQVDRVSPVAELIDGVRYYPAIAQLAPLAAFKLRAEMNVQCFVLVDFRRDVLTVPSGAVFAKGGDRVVYVDDGNGGAKAVTPRFGLADGQREEVLEGLVPGQRVAVKIVPEMNAP